MIVLGIGIRLEEEKCVSLLVAETEGLKVKSYWRHVLSRGMRHRHEGMSNSTERI